ncbi:MAG: hypothetical protein GVY21_10400 [Gammaproteobacteria bacterium]|jgi:hypothetical protein|nr:hypothetical protein [Gammaproteobacteria bacterium]
MFRWLKYTGLTLAGIALVVTVAVMIVQRTSDGPMEFLQGGPFKTGEPVEGPVTDWSFGVGRPMAFELVGFGTSRTAGYIMHDGKAYMTCDLGFMWSRLEGGYQRWLLHLIYLFKTWHLDALEDGRALLRIDGKLYKTQFVKVEDPDLDQALRDELEALAREFFAPRELGPPPAEPPNDVWFFRMDPRI